MENAKLVVASACPSVLPFFSSLGSSLCCSQSDVPAFSPAVQFSIAAETSYHRLSGLREHTCILSQFCRSEVWYRFRAKINVLAGLHSFLEALGRVLLFALSSF